MMNPQEVGNRLRELREKQRFSMRALALKAGVAVSFLSKVEAGRGSPTLATLLKLLEALEVSAPEFFGVAGEDAAGVLVIPQRRMQVVDDGDKLWRYLFPAHPDVKAVLTYEEYRPQTRHIEQEQHTSDMCGLVLAGVLTLQQPGRPDAEVRAGESFYIRAGTPHASANLGKGLLQMVVVELPHTTERPLTRRRRP
ncbi:MAG: hypothetical protein A3K19_02120 [Lentisphaerae bacterium RIFOXYB12_FULL_65_16]|nr:MAG: hypothetical protein A3K18_25340 [Lentisphaerae bacterium RIFOXYA12_64_32]OGV92594.1 MAG: hypothetical protein A3K19_02120 [Lentisphaerae bacterium RIFOXYB12_FULL_65_16]